MDPDCYRSKVASFIADGATATEATLRIHDVIRYTLQFEPADYADGVAAARRAMLAQGFEPVPGTFRVSWDSPGYRGINSSWRHPSTGEAFRLRCHTPDSLAATEQTQPWYEEERLPGTSEDRRLELRRLQSEVFLRVPVPPGATAVVDASVLGPR